MVTDVYRFLSNMIKSSVNVFITTMNSSVAEASTCTMKYFNETSVFYMFLTLDIKGMNDIRLISRPIHAPNHELDDTDTNTHLQLGIKFTLNSEDGETLKTKSSRIRSSCRSCVKDNEISRKSSGRCITKPRLKANSTVHVCSYTSYHYFHRLSHCSNNYIQGLTTLHSPYHHTTVTGLTIRTYRHVQNAHKKGLQFRISTGPERGHTRNTVLSIF